MINLGLTLSDAQRSAWWPQGARYAADFANNRYMNLGNAIDAAQATSFTRASPKWAADLNGTWHQFPADVLARTDAGASIEPAATNLISNSRLEGALVGVHGAGGSLPTGWYHNGPLTTEILAITTLAGLPALRIKVHGIAAGPFYELVMMPIGTAMAPSTAYAASIVIATHSGTAPAIELRQATSSDGLVAVNLLSPPASSTVSRPSLLFSSQSSTVRVRLRLSYVLTVGLPFSHEFTLASPQIEPGIKVTSPLLVPRAPDNLVLGLPAENHDIWAEHDDASVSTFTNASGNYPMSTNLSRSIIRKLVSS